MNHIRISSALCGAMITGFLLTLWLVRVSVAAVALVGDTNCDGRFDADDVLSSVQAIFNGASCAEEDVNHDGRRTVADLVAVVEALGWPIRATPTAMPTATPSPMSSASATETATLSPTATCTDTATTTPSNTPTLSPTMTSSATVSPTPSPTPTETASPTASRTATASPSPSFTNTSVPTASPSMTLTATRTLTAPPTGSATRSPTFTITATRTRTPTPTRTATRTATSTATPNPAPAIAPQAIYRTYPGYPIALRLDAVDPQGGPVHYSAADLPPGAQFDEASGHFEWTPSPQQLGAYVVPFAVSDEEVPPRQSHSALGIKVQPLDACVKPTCDTATGCSVTFPSTGTACCAAGPLATKIPEPAVDCPGARVLHVGRNVQGFGRLHNCDRLRARAYGQVGVIIRFNIEARCLDIDAPVQLKARMETASRLLFDSTISVNFSDRGDGYGERLLVSLPVLGASPFFDLEGAEANLVVSATDRNGNTATHRLRLVLQFDAIADLPETR